MAIPPYPTPLLDARLAECRQQWEVERQQVLATAQQWLNGHAADYGIAAGFIFGSVIQPDRFREGSDVDLAVETLTQGDPFGLISYLSLHLNRDVDLVALDQCPFADKIRQTGLPWTAST